MKAMFRNLLTALTIIFLPFPVEAQEITQDTPQRPAGLSEELDFPSAQPGARSRLMPEIVVDKVIAVVDGEPLTAGDLRRHIIAQGGTPPEDLRRLSPEVEHYLRELISENMLTREAESSGITVADDEIEAYIEEIKRQNGVDGEGFRALLKERGLTYRDYVTQVRRDILRARVMSAKVRSKINVLEEDIERHLAAQPQRRPQEGSVRLLQAFVPASGREVETLEPLLEEIKTKVRSGMSLAEAAGRYYLDLGYVIPKDLRAEIREAIDDIPSGEVSEIVPAENGAYLFVVSSRADETEIDDKLKEEIRQELYEARFRKEMDQFLNKELPKKYHVELKL